MLLGIPLTFRKKVTLRACKILYSFSANPVTNDYGHRFVPPTT
ncbi:hypothetical protein [Bacillus cereus]|nr:hypothetical protein [Bacillus cereus]